MLSRSLFTFFINENPSYATQCHLNVRHQTTLSNETIQFLAYSKLRPKKFRVMCHVFLPIPFYDVVENKTSWKYQSNAIKAINLSYNTTVWKMIMKIQSFRYRNRNSRFRLNANTIQIFRVKPKLQLVHTITDGQQSHPPLRILSHINE